MKTSRMKKYCTIITIPILALLMIVIIFPETKSATKVLNYWSKEKDPSKDHRPTADAHHFDRSSVASRPLSKGANDTNVCLAITLCGTDPKQEEQIEVLLKSAVITSLAGQVTGQPIRVVIVADSEYSYGKIAERIASWPPKASSRLSLSYAPVWYPRDKLWMKTFRTLCTTERLYYPDVLNEYDAVIHVDTDVIFLRPVQELWSYFSFMTSEQSMALAPEHEDPENAYYNSPVNKIPYYGNLGLNAGVILMNLTRIRQVSDPGWLTRIHDIYNKYLHAPLHFADQDILNIYFHDYPGQLLELPCAWNYRNDFCRFKMNTCSSAVVPRGVALLHGSRGVFLSNDEPAFKAVYSSFLEYDWQVDVRVFLVGPMMVALAQTSTTTCGIEPMASSYVNFLEKRFDLEVPEVFDINLR